MFGVGARSTLQKTIHQLFGIRRELAPEGYRAFRRHYRADHGNQHDCGHGSGPQRS
jgi:hypothetical protein